MSPVPVWETGGSVLLTGGTDARVTALARHLVTAHRVRTVMLAAPGADTSTEVVRLTAELVALGAELVAVSCDPADPVAVAELLERVPSDRPLTAVVHAAFAEARATTLSTTLEPSVHEPSVHERITSVLHLEELTRPLGLSAFVLLTSTAATLGGGTPQDAAVGAYLAALAERRRTAGLPGQAVAWGGWNEDADGMLRPLSDADALKLLDLAPRVPAAFVIAARVDRAAVNAADPDTVPAALRGTARALPPRVAEPLPEPTPTAQGNGGDETRTGLAALSGEQLHRALEELVRGTVATVLELADPYGIDTGRPFKELGFDSLMVVELRDALAGATGLNLPSALVFDHPTPDAVLSHLKERLSDGDAGTSVNGTAAAVPIPTTPADRADESGEHDDPIVIIGMSCRFPAGSARRRTCGGRSPKAGTSSAPSRTTVAGTCRDSTIPRATHLASTTCGKAASSTRPGSTPASSASTRVRRWPWTRSSGCSWRPPGKPSNAPKHRPQVPRKQPDRHLRLRHLPGLRPPPRRGNPGHRGLPDDRKHAQRCVRPGRLRPRTGGPRDHRRHRLLRIPGGPAHGHPVDPGRRVHHGPGKPG